MLHLGDKLAHLCPNKDFLFLRASIVPQVRVRWGVGDEGGSGGGSERGKVWR